MKIHLGATVIRITLENYFFAIGISHEDYTYTLSEEGSFYDRGEDKRIFFGADIQ